MSNLHFERCMPLIAALAIFACLPAHAQESPADFFRNDPFRPVASSLPPRLGVKRRGLHASRSVPAAPIRALVTNAAHRNGVPPRLLHGVVRIESGYRCHAYNRRGNAHGIGQVKPATARSVGVHGSLFNCSTGIEAAARYLRLALARGGSGCAGVSLYERGVYARPRCTAYGRKVMRMASND